MGANEHLAELDEIAVVFVVNFDDTPWITSTANFPAVGIRYLGIRSNNSERNLGKDFLVFCYRLFVVELVLGPFEDLDGVEVDIGQNLEIVSA